MKSLMNLSRMMVVAGCLLLTTSLAFAVPGTINYQGVLTDSGGTPLNEEASISFRLFDAASNGNQLWTETQNVTVTGGTYSVQLGAVTSLSGLDFSAPYWLEVEVAGETLSPRQALTSVPYAMRAGAVEESGLPADGLNEVSNGLLNNQFTETATSTGSIAIPDNNPSGVEDSIVFPSVGTSQAIFVSLHLTNSDLSSVTVTLTDPNATVYTLFARGAGGTELNTVYPNPTATVSGDLTTWIGQNPAGTWTLKVVDSGDHGDRYDGEVVTWSVASQHVSTQTVAVTADLDVAGTLSGDGSGLTSLDWGNLANVPSGFSDNIDDVVSSVDGLSGGQISSNVGIGTVASTDSQLSVVGSGSEPYGGYFDANYTGDSNSYSLYAINTASSAGKNFGLYAYSANASMNNYGLYAAGNGGVSATGLYATASGGTILNWGVQGFVSSSSAPTNYGVYGYAAYGTMHNYGVYGSASGTDAYAGYFNGDAKVTSDLSVAGDIGLGNDPFSNRKLYVKGNTADTYSGYFENNGTSGSAYGLYSKVQGAADHSAPYGHFGLKAVASGANFNYGSYSYAYDTSADTNFGVYGYASGGTTNWAGYFEGNVHVTGTLTQSSDRRLKENILPVENALAKVEAINGVYFNMIDNPEITEVGVIAQDVQPVLPEAVSVIDQEGHLGVSYTSLVPVLIEAVKELKAQNEALQTRIEALEGGGQ